MEGIDVRKVMGEKREQGSEEIRRDFIPVKGPSSVDAARRLAVTEEILRKWYNEINDTDTKCLPSELLMHYQKAFEIIIGICDIEKSIALNSEDRI